MAMGQNKPYFGGATIPLGGKSNNSWGGGWGMFNPFANPQQNITDPLTNGGLQGLTPEILQKLISDFQNSDFDTKAKMWSNKALQPYFQKLIGNDANLLNQLEMASWTSGGMDLSQYGLSQMKFTDMMKAKQNGGPMNAGQQPSNSNTLMYNPTYTQIPASGANPYDGMTALYRDPGGMIHDFGDNPVTTPPPQQIPWYGAGSGVAPWMGMGNTRQRRYQHPPGSASGPTTPGGSNPNLFSGGVGSGSGSSGQGGYDFGQQTSNNVARPGMYIGSPTAPTSGITTPNTPPPNSEPNPTTDPGLFGRDPLDPYTRTKNYRTSY